MSGRQGAKAGRKLRNAGAARTKAGLALALALGLALLFAGVYGQKAHEQSGFTSEDAYRAVSALARDVESGWTAIAEPGIDRLEPAARTELDGLIRRLVVRAWEGQKAGAGKDAEALTETADAGLAGRILYAAYLAGGPKIGAGERRRLAALGGDARERLLACAAEGSEQLPPEAEKLAGNLEGDERRAMLMQMYFISGGSLSDSTAEHVTALKKSVRDKGAQLEAFVLAARGGVPRLLGWVISGSRTLEAAGVLLILDVLLLAALMMREKSWIMDFKWILILLIIDFLLYFQVLPSVYTTVRCFFPEGRFSLETLRRLYTYPLNLEALTNTLAAAFATMILGTLIAFPLAFLVGRTNLYGRRIFRFLFVLTYMVPPYVGAMAWLRLMNPNVGTVNLWLRALLGLGDAPGPLNVYTLPGMIWVLTTFYYPYAFITISRAMEKMDPSLEEASRASGASPMRTVFRITLPMMSPSLIAGALLVFIAAASCYGIPSIIGKPGNVNTVTTRIVEYAGIGQQGMNDAIGMSVLLMAVALIVLFISDVLLARKQYITVSGKSTQPTTVDLRKWRIPLTAAVALFCAVVILLPFATILTTSFKTDVGRSVLEGSNFTLSNWTEVFARTETLNCLKNSLTFAAAAATFGLVIACVMSYLLQRTRIRGRNIPNFLITLGSGTPSVVIALGLIMTMRGNFGLDLYNTAWILIAAYMVKYMMMGMRTVVSAMSQIHPSLEECSQAAGASWIRTMLRITGPLIFPSIAAGWFLIFIPSFYELSMTTLLYSSTTKTIGYQLYEYWTFTSQPQSCAMAFGILLFVAGLNLALNRLTRGEFSI